jgi:hypothetical protein
MVARVNRGTIGAAVKIPVPRSYAGVRGVAGKVEAAVGI